jgi:tetratricopeptide (TPR) repeat protein
MATSAQHAIASPCMADDTPAGPWGAGPSAGDIASAGLDKARAFLDARNADAAIREAERVFSADPNGPFGYRALDIIGDAHTQKGDFSTVAKIGRELLSIDPERIEGYLHLAQGALERDDMRTAIDAIERGLTCNPHSLSLTILNAIRFRRCHDTTRAIEWAEKAVAMAPWHPGALNALGFALADAERPDEAKRAFEEARALDPMAAYTISTTAAVAFNENRYAEAEELALQALALDPQDGDAQRIVYRARWFKSIFMRPYWAIATVSKKQAMVAAAIILGLLVLLTPFGLARFLMPALLIYYLVCMFIVLLVQALDDPKRPRKPPKLKDY